MAGHGGEAELTNTRWIDFSREFHGERTCWSLMAECVFGETGPGIIFLDQEICALGTAKDASVVFKGCGTGETGEECEDEDVASLFF